ncbi:cytochrome b/b6 domain-containing protein [Celeribacter marinus]|nr:cytochrome b/b6 domain-containing protein [Celeribacter marinus]SFK59402.1 Cytochrome b [Celeribacter marinus]
MTETYATEREDGRHGAESTIRVWDPLVRMFHWGLVAAFAAAYLSAEELSTVHEVAGYIVAGLVAFRLIWGFAGSRYARFAQFMKGPSATVRYLGDMVSGRERRYLGHNPAGAAMIVALLITLSGTAFTGWLMEDETRMTMLPDFPQIVAPAWADDDGDERAEHGEGGESALGEVHETLANLMLLLIAVHVGGVVLASFRHRENLARAMVTGTKRAPEPGDVA